MLSLGHNWDPALPPRLAGTDVRELYSALPMSAVGAGRPAIGAVRRPSRREAAAQIASARGLGLRFNYLINATCLDNAESTRQGQRALRRSLDWCVDAGVDAVTVSTPFVAGFVRRHYPSLAIQVSMFAAVATLERLRHWEDFGATVVTLDPSINRDLPLLERLSTQARAELQVIANNACLMHCPHVAAHANEISHASQRCHPSGGLYLGYSTIRCRLAKLEDPLAVIKADWIRPEDRAVYEAVGIRRFKLVDRLFPTDTLLQVVRAYTERTWTGNLLDLFPHSGKVQCSLASAGRLHQLAGMARYLVKPTRINPFRLRSFERLLENMPFEVDNASLDGFIEPFRTQSCRDLDCDECGHCARYAARALRYDARQLREVRDYYREIVASLESDRIYAYGVLRR